MVSRIEAVLDAIAELNQAGVPESLAYKLRNPLLLKSFAKLGRHLVNTDGLREFGSHLAGYKAAAFDLDLKLKGLSRAGLKPEDPLSSLLRCYGINDAVHRKIVSFIKRALDDQSITASTQLSFFLEGSNGR